MFKAVGSTYNAPMTRLELLTAERNQLQAYLESWGAAVYDHEPTELIRESALENNSTEGDGWGPMERGYPIRQDQGG